VFRSKQRPVVYPQAEHSRLSGVIAAAWIEPTPLPFASLVRGVAVHDRGYGELDADPLGEMPPQRWLEITRRGFAAQDDDPIVDLVVALHLHRLVSGAWVPVEPEVLREFDAGLEERFAASGVDRRAATAADEITNLCDALAFDFSFEQEGAGRIGSIEFTVAPDGSATLSPWPLRVPELRETVVGYEAEGYPERLEPVERAFVVRPAGAAARNRCSARGCSAS
jgi:hypothetical protein